MAARGYTAITDTLVSVGYVTGLDYEDPRTDPHHVFQSFKEHKLARRILEGGKMIRYGAKSLPYGGWLTMPRIYGNGWMLLGDSASFLNSQRLKGIHLAIRAGCWRRRRPSMLCCRAIARPDAATLSPVQVITLTYGGVDESGLAAFGQWIAGSAWLDAVGASYSVRAGQQVAALSLGEAPATDTTDALGRAWPQRSSTEACRRLPTPMIRPSTWCTCR